MGPRLHSKLEQRLGYKFNNPDLLRLALTHRSHGKLNNERLEFLGDTMLSSVISSYLYEHYNEFSEGALSQARAVLVNKHSLAEIAAKFELKSFLILGGSEQHNDISKQEAIIADAFEAIVGAIYIDADWQQLNQILITWFQEKLTEIADFGIKQHPKSSLQEWTQAKSHTLPKYTVVKKLGPSHSALFVVECRIEGLKHKTIGEGTAKQQAEEVAAEKFLEWLEQNKYD